MSETTTIYVTKDATSRGIHKTRAIIEDGYATGLNEKGEADYRFGFFSKSQFYFTLPEAIADAEKRRAKKIASLEYQLGMLRALDLSTAVEG